MARENAFIVFQPAGRRGVVPRGITIIEASRRIGVDIEALCGESQVCGKCKVRIESGRYDKFGIDSGPGHVSAWQESESKYITAEERAAGYRLGCVARVAGDLLVYVPETSRAGKQVVSKAARAIAIDLNPAVRVYTAKIAPADLDHPTGAAERLREALSAQCGLKGDLAIDLMALRILPAELRKGQGTLAVYIWMDREIIGVTGGEGLPGLGLAVDIGTTTIAGYLCDLATGKVLYTASLMNPQVKYGEDVISRISYHLNHEEGLRRMSRDLVAGINRLIDDALAGAGNAGGRALFREDIVDMAVCCNTAMHHILLQLDPTDLGSMPFAPVARQGLDLKARDLGIAIHPAANLYILPNIAGFVGADNVGVMIAEAPYASDTMELIIDIGTNGELVLGNARGVVVSSCATGPALEGAQIEFGMRAAPGAIERVRVDPETHEVDYKVVGRNPWRSFSPPEEMGVKGICGSGVLDTVGELYKAGVVKKDGAFNKAVQSPRLRENPDTGIREFVLAWAAEASIERDVVITQKDIRQIQLAKAAVYTGCKLMMRRLGVTMPDKVKIAGAFGTHLDRTLALVAGLFPDCPLEAIESVGNAAGDGCRLALLDRRKRKEAERVARRVDYLELTLETDFQEQLLDALAFPHQKDPFPHLAGVVPDEILRQP